MQNTDIKSDLRRLACANVSALMDSSNAGIASRAAVLMNVLRSNADIDISSISWQVYELRKEARCEEQKAKPAKI